MKISQHQYALAKTFCVWVCEHINNDRLFEPSIQLEEGGTVLLVNQGRYMVRNCGDGGVDEFLAQSLVSPWRKQPDPTIIITRPLIQILKWSIEDHFALTFRQNEYQDDCSEASTEWDAETKGVGPNHPSKEDPAVREDCSHRHIEAHKTALDL